MFIACCLISLVSDRICFHQLLDSAFINVTPTRVTLTVEVSPLNHGSKNIYLKFFVLILSKLPIQAAYRILVQQDSDALMVACP